ncbi:hypothetical protein DPEC_G00041240 [Dallia pectoralis]|uniref:Uncharacterized protein n=1 Tax=Dallia pectoralis TaxID=75939 RepID=A0ACC2HF59_DALPE|nr:hypothetical protein DPEC_G00041240 [Dallia pectoralis]
MEEYYASEADAREARPRCQTRPPQHLHDYEAQWDAVPQWDNPSHHHGGYGPEMQLAHSRQRGGQHNEEIREATPHWEHWKKSADHQAELDMIRYENKLHSTRLAITGQMAELERVKYEMMLMDKASSLHPHSDATGNHYTPAKSTRQPPAQTTWFDSTLPPSIPPSVSEEGSNESEEEYNEEEYSKWPEPPPWPTEVRPKQQEGEQVVELLNRMMGELKVIRDQAIPVVAKPSQTQAVNAPGHTWQHPRGLNHHQYGGYSQPLQQVSEAPPQHYSGTAGQRFIPARPDPPVAAFGPPDTARQRTVEYQYESWCQDYDSQSPGKVWRDKPGPKLEVRQGKRTVSILHGTKTHPESAVAPSVANRLNADKKGRAKPYCPYCNNSEHYLNQCSAIQSLNKEKVTEWIKTNKKCWRCGRDHQASQCTLKKPCGICQGTQLQVLHEVNIRPPKEAAKEESCLVNTATEVLYLELPVDCNRVLLNVARVTLYHGNRTLDTYAILDDGSERTMLLPEAAQKLGIQGNPEELALRTIRQDIQTLKGSSVSFRISPACQPKTTFQISGAFTASRIGLADHTYPVASLQKRYKHLVGIPLQSFTNARPLITPT